jgi:hypothetical protein
MGILWTVGFRPQLVVVSSHSMGISLTVGFRPQLVVVSGLSVGIPLTVGFRSQLVVVSDLSVGIPLTVGFRLSRSLWLSRSPFTKSSSFAMEFWLSRSLSHELFFFHDGILAITKPFTRTFLFSPWNSGYHEAFHTNFSFFTMEFWLSRSLSHELFFFQDGILAIMKPFIRTLLFSRWNRGYHGAFSRIFLSHDGISAITGPFHEFSFHTMESTKYTIWGKTLFIYITKSIYIGFASLKTLPVDLEPPLQGK